jgi:hypothetical protein
MPGSLASAKPLTAASPISPTTSAQSPPPLHKPFLAGILLLALLVLSVRFVFGGKKIGLWYYHIHLCVATIFFVLTTLLHRALITKFPSLDPSILAGYVMGCAFYVGKEIGDYSKLSWCQSITDWDIGRGDDFDKEGALWPVIGLSLAVALHCLVTRGDARIRIISWRERGSSENSSRGVQMVSAATENVSNTA